MVYKPKSGQVPYETGPMQAGVPVGFEWTTPADVHDQGKGGGLQVVTPPGFNARFTVELNGIKKGPSQLSDRIAFGPGPGKVPMLPKTKYTGSVVCDLDSPGVTLKLGAR